MCLQSSDSTQIGECPHRKSPVFPSSYCKAEVQVPRLCPDVVQSCMSSGFVWSSQDSLSLRSLPAHCRSPTFPKSPERSGERGSRKSPVFSEGSREDGGESTPENYRSPVFAGNSRSGRSPSPCRSQVHNCNSGFTFSSQGSLTSVARIASRRPQSPVFPKSPAEMPATRKSPGSSDSCEGEAEHLHSRSPVFGGTERLLQTRLEVQEPSVKEASQRTKKRLKLPNSAAQRPLVESLAHNCYLTSTASCSTPQFQQKSALFYPVLCRRAAVNISNCGPSH